MLRITQTLRQLKRFSLFQMFTDKTSYLRELSPYLPGDGGDKADVFLFGEVSILLMVCLVCDDFLCETKKWK